VKSNLEELDITPESLKVWKKEHLIPTTRMTWDKLREEHGDIYKLIKKTYSRTGDKIPDDLVKAIKKTGGELEGPLFPGGSLSWSSLRHAPKGSSKIPQRKETRKVYNNLRESIGLEKVTNWKERPTIQLGISEKQARELTKKEGRNFRTLKQTRNKELSDAAGALADESKSIDVRRAEHLEVIDSFRKEWDMSSIKDIVGSLPTFKEIAMSVGTKANRLGTKIIGFNDSLKLGDWVRVRLDIPAYDKYNIWTLAIHSPTGGKVGDIIGYGRTARMKNVTFSSGTNKDFEKIWGIAKEGKGKYPMATMKGKWVDHNSEDLAQDILNLVDDKAWKQVGFNPQYGTRFHLRGTGETVTAAEEVIQ
ncbi:uncharacterized protein METZ01_LOCUS318092, partial [marine metagenome]